MTTIVVIEDEASIAQAVADRLHSEGFDVAIAHDGAQGVALVAEVDPDLVILDLMLPGIDGLEVCRRIQQARPVPILMLTARATEADLLVGLAVGADDYMTKPFSPRELVARVRAILRRVDHARAADPTTGAGAAAPTTTLVLGDVELNPATRRVLCAGAEVHLTPTEFDLLHHLGRQPGVVFSREQLLVDVWGYRDGYGARTVDSHIRALRHKLGAGLVRTVHGVGYSVETAGPSGPLSGPARAGPSGPLSGPAGADA